MTWSLKKLAELTLIFKSLMTNFKPVTLIPISELIQHGIEPQTFTIYEFLIRREDEGCLLTVLRAPNAHAFQGYSTFLSTEFCFDKQ